MKKIQQDACRLLAQTSVSVRELAQSIGKALPLAPPSTTVSDEFCTPNELYTGGDEEQIQHFSSAEPNEQSWSIMVAIPGQEVTVKPYCTNSPIHHNKSPMHPIRAGV